MHGDSLPSPACALLTSLSHHIHCRLSVLLYSPLNRPSAAQTSRPTDNLIYPDSSGHTTLHAIISRESHPARTDRV